MKVVSEKTGFLFLLGFVVFTGFVGIALAKAQGKMHLKKIQEELAAGKLPGNPVVEGLMILIAAAVLITPGFITDLLGFLLLIPWVRRIIAPRIAKNFKPKVTGQSSFSFHSNVNISGMEGGKPKDPQARVDADFFDMPEDDDDKGSDVKGNIEEKK